MKKRIRILFYKSKWGDKKWIDNLISLWTWSKYSHVEIWTPHEEQRGNPDFYASNQWMYPHAVNVDPATGYDIFVDKAVGTCWTSTLRGDSKGTVKRDASGILDHPYRWDYIELEIDEEQYCRLLIQMDIEVSLNKGYSKWDLLKFVSPIHFPDNMRNICSEFCNNMLYVILILKGYGIVSPGKLFKKLTKLGHKSKPLE